MHHHHDHDEDDHDKGLVFDLQTMATRAKRRDVLRMMAGAGVVSGLASLFAACGDTGGDGTIVSGGAGTGSSGGGSTTGSTSTGGSSTTGGTSTTGGDGCQLIPPETEGPYPGDGSNGPNALTTSGVVRSDIRSSFGSYAGTAAGIPLVIQLTLTNVNASCSVLPDYAIYLWHCDREGRYSLYDLPSQNYLRGVQVTDEFGTVTFTSIFPGCYAGRWPHLHFEVYPSLASTNSASNKVRTSQVALPSNACSAVYATSGYESSTTNFNRVSLQTDNVFGDGADLQIPSISGSVSDGYVITLDVGIGV